MAYISRRELLAGMAAAGFGTSLGALSGLSGQRAWAANTSGYKAMVCIFLKGGMDQSDTILPYDQPSYDALKANREGMFASYNSDADDSSRNRNNLLRLNPINAQDFGGRQFAMPRELAPLHNMFEAGDLSVVGNVGPLIQPTTRAEMINGTAILPPRLFSHNDQQSTWMSSAVEGSRYGWGGRFMDAVLQSSPSDDATFATISTGSRDVFLAGENARPFRVTDKGAPETSLTERRWYLGYTDEDDAARARIREHLERNDFENRNIFEQDVLDANQRAHVNSARLLAARENEGPFTTEFQNGGLSKQMKAVAETIKIRQYLSVSRQMYYVTTGGFDSHSGQSSSIPRKHDEIAQAIDAFRNAMIEIGEWDNVVVFTASDFGRTVIDNGNGTDHGWGAHHLVAGGQVQGRRIYGDMPGFDIGSSSYTESRGRLIPSTSVEQYAATIGSWFGLESSEMRTALPNLGNFNTQNLGFMSGGTS